MIVEPPPKSSQESDSLADLLSSKPEAQNHVADRTKTPAMSSALTLELRARNRELLVYGTRSALGLATLAVVAVFLTVLFFLQPKTVWVGDWLFFCSPMSGLLVTWAVYNIAVFDSVNRAALPLFERITQHLEARENRRYGKKSLHENGKTESELLPLGISKAELELISPTSRLYIRLALEEYCFARQMPFLSRPSGYKTYLLLSVGFGLWSIIVPIVLIVVWGTGH